LVCSCVFISLFFNQGLSWFYRPLSSRSVALDQWMGFVDVHSFRFSPSCTSLLACFASRLSLLICKWSGFVHGDSGKCRSSATFSFIV